MADLQTCPSGKKKANQPTINKQKTNNKQQINRASDAVDKAYI